MTGIIGSINWSACCRCIHYIENTNRCKSSNGYNIERDGEFVICMDYEEAPKLAVVKQDDECAKCVCFSCLSDPLKCEYSHCIEVCDESQIVVPIIQCIHWRQVR